MELEIIQPRVGKKWGGIVCHQIDVVEVSGVQSFGEVINGFYISNPVLKSGFDWQTLNAAKNTSQFTESPAVENGAQVFGQQMKIAWSGDDSELMNKMNKMARLGVLIRFKTRSGDPKIMGHLDAPVRFAYDRDSKVQRSETNRVNGIYRCKSNTPVYSLVY